MELRKLVLVPAVLVFAGCTSLLGDFALSTDVADAGDATTDATPDATNPADDAGDQTDAEASAGDDSAVGDTGADAEAGPPCGALGEPCCAGACANGSLTCINGECHSASTGDLGNPCNDGGTCASGVCIGVGGDAGECTNACSPDAGTTSATDAGLGDQCLSGWSCGTVSGSTTPICKCTRTAETCNGKDDDCDGVVDNGTVGKACNTGLKGICAAGTSTCTNGNPGCPQNQQPGVEVCDGLDNNCNGQVDEGNPGGGGSCTVPGAKGACAIGVYTCTGGQIQCVSQYSPSSAWHYTAAPNGSWDWNCDGTVTESEPNGGAFWGIAYQNCTSGQTYESICTSVPDSAPVCNGSGIYYHCQPGDSNNDHCGEAYYEFWCAQDASTGHCSYNSGGSLSAVMSDGCY